MAARKRLTHTQKTRDKIQTSMILQRLEKFIQSDPTDEDCKVKMSPAQVTAALGLMKKTLPDLSNVELTGEDGGPVQVEKIKRSIVHPND